MSSSVDAAEAIVTAIRDAQTAGTFARQFRLERAYVPTFALEDREPEGLTVVVTPAQHGNENLTRGSNVQLPVIVIAVIEKLSDLRNETLDPLIGFVEQLKELVSGSLVVGGANALLSIPQDPLFDPDRLVTQRLFWSKISVNFRVFQ